MQEELKKLGLSSGESRVYIALLSLGSSTVGPIVKKSKVAYSKVYEVLQRLIEKGVASFTIKEKTKYFQALEPDRLKEYIQRKEIEVEKSKKLLNNILPSLKSLLREKNKQASEVFVGEKGIMTAYDILLDKAENGSTLRFFYMPNQKYDEKVYDFCYGRINYNNKKIIPELKKKKMKWLGIINQENSARKLKAPKKPIIQRYVDFPIPGNIDITDTAILITIWAEKPIGILIESKEVAENYRNYFDSIWSIARS